MQLINFSEYEAFLKRQGKSASTVSSYVSDAQVFIHFLDANKILLKDISTETGGQFQKYLIEDCGEKQNSVRRTIIGVRQLFRYMAMTGLIPDSPFDLFPIPERNETLRTKIELDKIEDLLDVAEKQTPQIKAFRDRAIVTLLAFEGVKATELVNMKWSDLVLSGDVGSLKIVGPRSRVIDLSVESLHSLRNYRTEFQKLDDHYSSKNMFVAFKGRNSSVVLNSLTRHGLKFALYELGTAVKIEHLNSEDLRHCAIQYQLGIGKSMEQILNHLGLKRPGLVSQHSAIQSKTNAVKDLDTTSDA